MDPLKPKNQKYGSDTHKLCIDEILLLKVWARGVGETGSKLKVQDMDSYPVNECIPICKETRFRVRVPTNKKQIILKILLRKGVFLTGRTTKVWVTPPPLSQTLVIRGYFFCHIFFNLIKRVFCLVVRGVYPSNLLVVRPLKKPLFYACLSLLVMIAEYPAVGLQEADPEAHHQHQHGDQVRDPS